MTWVDIFSKILIPCLSFITVVILIPLFKRTRSLELTIVELKGNQTNLKDKLHHIEGNYKQGIEHMNEEMTDLKSDIKEMHTEIKELVKWAYSRGKPDE